MRQLVDSDKGYIDLDREDPSRYAASYDASMAPCVEAAVPDERETSINV